MERRERFRFWTRLPAISTDGGRTEVVFQSHTCVRAMVLDMLGVGRHFLRFSDPAHSRKMIEGLWELLKGPPRTTPHVSWVGNWGPDFG